MIHRRILNVRTFPIYTSIRDIRITKEVTGRETEPWEIIYFKLYTRARMPVIERAIETAAVMPPRLPYR
jgi:hypothetical protein